MTTDSIRMARIDSILMAREARALFSPGISATDVTFSPAALERFAAIATAAGRAAAAVVKLEARVKESYQAGHKAGAAAEREACAQVCDHNASLWECLANDGADDMRYDWKADAGHGCADDIRARSQS